MSTGLVSYETGRELVRQLVERMGSELRVVLFYATANHHQPELARGAREGVPKSVPVLGCSVQGIISRAGVTEDKGVAGEQIAALGTVRHVAGAAG